MKKLQKILIPVDFSSVSANAVQYANGILEKHLTEVVLVHVNTHEISRNETDIKREFRIFEAEVLKGVSFYYEFEILNGNLLSELLRATKLFQVDMVIMGTKGKRESDLSLASSLIHAVYCPVIVVPEHFKKNQIRRIAYANDYQPLRESEVLKPLWEFVLEFQAKVYLLHVNNKRKEKLVPADEMEDALEYYLDSFEHEYVYVSSDDMELAINHFIKENKIDLLVILSRDHGNNQLKSEGLLIAQLTAHAEIPILALC